MSRAFNLAARRHFIDAVPTFAPQFRIQPPGPKPFACPGEVPLAWAPDPARVAWVFLVPSPKGYNEFTIELGWSLLARYPQLTLRPSFHRPTPERTEWKEPEYICRLNALTAGVPEWWGHGALETAAEDPETLLTAAMATTAKLTPTEAERVAEPLVAGAVEALVATGIPYLQAWNATRG